MPQVNLTADDVFELKMLRDRALKAAQKSKEAFAGNVRIDVNTATTREAQHALETLDRILRQV